MTLYSSLPYWDQRELVELLTLESDGHNRFRSHVCDVNVHGGVYCGQLLAQSLWAAGQGLRARSPSVLQMTTLHAARTADAIEYSIETLRDSQRFSHRHVYGVQGTGLIFSASVAFQQTEAEPELFSQLDLPIPDPESLPTLDQLARLEPQRCASFQLRFNRRPVLDVRPIHVKAGEGEDPEPREVGYWIRLSEPLPQEGCLHQAALAYMSSCWLNPSFGPSLAGVDLWQLSSITSLNHSLWFHSAQINANDWLLFIHDSTRNRGTRDLATTRIYQRSGQLVASMAQDMLMSSRV